ncbi:phosphate ABC transporter permease subunit PstC [Mycobacterium tuberculosis]|uniref:phosphate ABC transporter permease subunit PstC n=30 Tax=Mycobacterium tuberculosis TaxID=1773 RepID=UPI0005E79AD5|nr:phosphate ABC transporter permease subunit PstC [Mycobacterium tuberculosis]CLX86352.1 phosphate ABC transporter [Mycobacterium tuberculosis]
MVTEPLTKPALVAVDMRPARRGERLFKLAASAAGSTIVIAILLIAIFLLVRAVPSLRANHANFFTSTQFDTSDDEQLAFGVRDLFMVTALSSITALVLAVPVAVGIAVFLTHYAPRRLSRPFGAMVDLLAAVPSIIFGLWGIFVLAPKLEPIARFLNRNLGWLFLFKQGNVSLAGGGTIFTAGIVLSVMILPIVTSISREVFRQTPLIQIEAALALGATKWEVVRMTVLPYGRSGVVAASMLGLGRALGETVAVLVILRSAARPGTWSLFDGGYTFASKIASAASEFSEPLPTGAYISAGFALFVFSLWIATLGFQQSAFAVALALVLLMLPVVVRAGEEMLRLVPDELREASYALGVPKWKTIVRIVAPIAMPGIVSGILLSIARVVGETAPVLVLVGYSHSINLDVFHGNMASLPLLIYTELTNPEHAGFLRVWGAALTLIIVVATINLAAAMIRFVATRRR